jgi:hypothetical protein
MAHFCAPVTQNTQIAVSPGCPVNGLRKYGGHSALADCGRVAIDASGITIGIRALPLSRKQENLVMTTRFTPRHSSKHALKIAGLAALVALAACSGNKERPKADLAASRVTTIGVNSYLWRASLETLSFMPLVQTDSNGGVIVTDWYANPDAAGERMKLTVTILDQDLRADALRVAASRQVMQGGQWIDAPAKAATVQKLEEVILTKARDLRRMAIGERD